MRTVAMLLCALLNVACAKRTDDWLRDLGVGEPFARELAAAALGEAPAEQAERVVAALARALRDEDAGVRDRAARSLCALAPRAVSVVVEALAGAGDRAVVEHLADAVVAAGPAALPHLSGALREASGAHAWDLARALGRLGGDGAAELHAHAARAGADQLGAALAGLDVAGVAAADLAAPIDRLLAMPEAASTVRSLVAHTDGVAALLVRAVAGREERARERLLTPVVGGLLERLPRREAWPATALRALGPQVIVPVIAALDDPRVESWWLSATLVALGPASLHEMLARLDPQRVEHRQCLATVVKLSAIDVVVPVCAQALAAESVRTRLLAVHALRALAQAHRERVAPLLDRASEDRDAAVRELATR